MPCLSSGRTSSPASSSPSPMRTAVRLDIEQRRAVDAVETAHRNHSVIDADQPHQRGADGIRPVGRAQREGTHGAAVVPGALGNQVAPAAIEPVEHLELLVGFEPFEGGTPDRQDDQAALGSVVAALPRASIPVRPGGADLADEAQLRVVGLAHLDRAFVSPNLVTVAHSCSPPFPSPPLLTRPAGKPYIRPIVFVWNTSAEASVTTMTVPMMATSRATGAPCARRICTSS